MKKTKMEKGITLIALIITIVVLLILAVVAISTIRNDNLIAHANNSTSLYANRATQEGTILESYLGILEEVRR